nr:hypothetical protein [Pseudoroseomonas aestuarii]
MSYIGWGLASGGPTLKNLMEKRFHITLGFQEHGSWEKVFDEEKEMTGHQKKYSHILDRTFLRPRDIIKFTNEILNAYKNSPEQNGKFSNANVIEARTNYSEYLLSELDDEIRKHYPDYEKYLEILKSLGSLQFTSKDFENAASQRKYIFNEMVPHIEIMSRLFHFSVIGYSSPGGITGGAGYVWKHKDRRAKFNENATNYRIHSGFMEVLGLKKFTKSRGGR